jgi:hypothetical protein
VNKVPLVLPEDRRHKAKVQAVFVDGAMGKVVMQKLKFIMQAISQTSEFKHSALGTARLLSIS